MLLDNTVYFFCYNVTVKKHVDFFRAKMYMSIHLNFVVYLIQIFKLMKWHNKYYLMPILLLFFCFPDLMINSSKKKLTDCKTYVSNLLFIYLLFHQ